MRQDVSSTHHLKLSKTCDPSSCFLASTARTMDCKRLAAWKIVQSHTHTGGDSCEVQRKVPNLPTSYRVWFNEYKVKSWMTSFFFTFFSSHSTSHPWYKPLGSDHIALVDWWHHLRFAFFSAHFSCETNALVALPKMAVSSHCWSNIWTETFTNKSWSLQWFLEVMVGGGWVQRLPTIRLTTRHLIIAAVDLVEFWSKGL